MFHSLFFFFLSSLKIDYKSIDKITLQFGVCITFIHNRADIPFSLFTLAQTEKIVNKMQITDKQQKCILFNYTLHNSNVVVEINIKQAKWMHCCYLGNGFVSKVGGYQRTGSLLLLLTIKAINKLLFFSFSSILLTIIAVTVLLSDFHLFWILFYISNDSIIRNTLPDGSFIHFFSCLVHH